MTAALNITYESAPQPDELATVRAGLSAYNRQHAPDDAYQPVTLFVRNAQGTIVGGLLGGTFWHWLYVEILWLSEEIRAYGYGRRLLAEAERMAVERDCIAVQLDTMSFQPSAFMSAMGTPSSGC